MSANPSARLWAALAAYTILALAAWQTLEGKLLWMTWIVLGAFAVRTITLALRPPED